MSWKKQSTLGNRTFTIGVSLIGGNDIIGINPGAIGSPGNYKYFDESDYVLSLEWDRGLNYPLGGLSMAMAGAELGNTSDRFTPDYMGGQGELFTAILPRRPMIINGGFNFDGIDQTIPQFSGILTKQPRVNKRDKSVQLQGADYVDFFKNRYLDNEVMFTAQRTDEVLESLFQSMGMSTAQYELDEGLNTIPFGLFDKGTRFADIMHSIVEAENGQLYQDEQGVFIFENRQHWYANGYNSVQRILTTAQVIEAETPDEDSIINLVEIKSKILQKQPSEQLFKLSQPLSIAAGATESMFVNFDNPVLQLDTVTFYAGNTASDESGTDITSSIQITKVDKFAKAVKIFVKNNNASAGYLTQLTLYGRSVKEISDLYYREKNGISVTAYEEKPITIENPYIQNISWADSLANLLLNQYSTLESQQKIVIRAIPELQMGDLISWQGRYWRVYDIKSKLSANDGFVQELTLLKRDLQSYFTIGISTIGGSDQIAP